MTLGKESEVASIFDFKQGLQQQNSLIIGRKEYQPEIGNGMMRRV